MECGAKLKWESRNEEADRRVRLWIIETRHLVSYI